MNTKLSYNHLQNTMPYGIVFKDLSFFQAQPSPTTGKFQFAPPNKDGSFEGFDASSFAFKTVPDPAPASTKVDISVQIPLQFFLNNS